MSPTGSGLAFLIESSPPPIVCEERVPARRWTRLVIHNGRPARLLVQVLKPFTNEGSFVGSLPQRALIAEFSPDAFAKFAAEIPAALADTLAQMKHGPSRVRRS